MVAAPAPLSASIEVALCPRRGLGNDAETAPRFQCAVPRHGGMPPAMPACEQQPIVQRDLTEALWKWRRPTDHLFFICSDRARSLGRRRYGRIDFAPTIGIAELSSPNWGDRAYLYPP